MVKVIWTAENDRKLLIQLIDRAAKAYPNEELCHLFPGATPKAIEERIAKLKREAKGLVKNSDSSSNQNNVGRPKTKNIDANMNGKKGQKRPFDDPQDDEEVNDDDNTCCEPDSSRLDNVISKKVKSEVDL